jgi:hypothetical protein
MRGPNAKPQTKRCAVGAGYEAGGRQGAEQPTLIGPPAPRPTTSPLTRWAAALRPSSPLHAAGLRRRSGVRMRCKVAGLRPGNVAERPQAERAGGQRPATRQHQPTPNDKDAKLRGAIAALLLVTELSLLVSHRSGRRPPGFRRFRLAGLGSAAPAGSGGWSCARRRRSACTSPQSGGTAGCARRGRRSWR